MSAGAAFKPPSMHLRRVRDLLTQEGVTTDLDSVIDETISLTESNWPTVDRNERDVQKLKAYAREAMSERYNIREEISRLETRIFKIETRLIKLETES